MCGLFTFKRLIAESEWFTTYRPNEYNTRLFHMSTLILPNLMTSHSRQSVRWVGAWTTGGAPRCFTKLQCFQETTQKGLSESATGRGAPLVVRDCPHD